MDLKMFEIGFTGLLVIISYATFAHDNKKEIKREIVDALDKKADMTVLEDKCRVLHNRINSKAEGKIVESMAKDIREIRNYIMGNK